MTAIPFRNFTGEVPRLPAWELPEGHGQQVVNCDLQHGEVRGLRGNAQFAQATLAGAIRAIWTDDGASFYAWPYDTYVVKSLVVGERFFRIYYTSMLSDGPIIKVARTRIADGSAAGVAVIGTARVGGNFQPPENSNPAQFGGNSQGPDSWILGVPAPQCQATAITDILNVALVDKPAWPGVPKLQLVATFFFEAPDGSIVFQQDITNNENGQFQGVTYPQVFYTVNMNNVSRGNKIQDYLWDLHRELGPRPYKYYWFFPPNVATAALSRTVIVTNTDAVNPIVISYDGAATPATAASDSYTDSGA